MVYALRSLISIALVCAVVCASARAFALPAACQAKGVVTLMRPVDPDQAGSPSFPFRFRVIGARADLPTVILIPGGPGQTTMQKDPQSFFPPGMLDSINLVLTDPRGAGCNAPEGAPFPDNFYRSTHVAGDVLAAVRALAPGRYVLWGVSYGTLIATMAGTMAGAEGVPQPSAIVLDSTVGRHVTRAEADQGYLDAWTDFMPDLAPATLTGLSAATAPLGFSALEWGDWLHGSLLGLASDVPVAGGPPGNLLKLVLDGLFATSPPSADALGLARAWGLGQPGPAMPDDFARVHRLLSCREWAPEQRAQGEIDFALVGTQLEPQPRATYCDGLTFDRPFDAAEWPLSGAVVYVQGTRDPATPPAQSRYHFDHQPRADRYLITFAGAGHSTLGSGILDQTCGAALWRAVLSGSFDFGFVANSCGLPASVEHAGAALD
jgi:pimeloyl-ACP methyl ester carboxylesterase